MTRQRLPNRRRSETFGFNVGNVAYTAIRHALLRDHQDRGATPLGVALDMVANQDGAP
jgi:hypothetical protein